MALCFPDINVWNNSKIQNPEQMTQEQYRKKPVVVNAFQMTEKRGNDNSEWPHWLHDAWQKGKDENGSLHLKSLSPRIMEIKTLEGNHIVSWDDWIIQGVKGEIYPCKPDIFQKTYEPV